MSITFLELGNYGRLGNQLFQIATVIGLAKRHNMQYAFPAWKYNKFFTIGIPEENNIKRDTVYIDKIFKYHEIPIKENLCNEIIGYFQTEKYFKDFRPDIINHFTLKPEYINLIKSKLPVVFSDQITCSIHVRRGDYLTKLHCHPVQSIEYYQKAMNTIQMKFPNNKIAFLVFSDDFEWCASNLIKDDNITFINLGEDILDLFAMSYCNHNIIANSSFSWWSAWLNSHNDKIVISPHSKRWFGPGITDDSTDIPCESWIKLNF